MTDLPAPPVPADCDLTGFAFVPLEIERLRRSRSWLSAKRKPELAFYMLNLWMASWHSIPAASLEDDEEVIADLAMCPPAKWNALRELIMRGWFKASDGRLYHPVVAEKARSAWAERLSHRARTEAARLAKQNRRNAATTSVTESVTEVVTGSKREGEGEREGKEDEANASSARSSASSPDQDFLTDDPTGQPCKVIPPGGSLGDLEAMHPLLLVPREERAKASTVLALYGWDLCAQALTALAAEAATRPANRRRIFPDHLSTWLVNRFDLGPEDYARAGITPPPKA